MVPVKDEPLEDTTGTIDENTSDSHDNVNETNDVSIIVINDNANTDTDVKNNNNSVASSPSPSPSSYKQHLIDVSNITYPIILSEFFQNTLTIVDIAFIGNYLSKNELGGAALATVWFNLWNTTMMGYMTAIDTLLSQSYGSNQYDKYGMWTGNSLIIIFLTTIPVSIIIGLGCGPLMSLFGQDPELVNIAADFSYRLVPGLFPYFLFKVLTKYLQSQSILAPSVWIGIVANIMNALLNWLLIYKFNWGINGAPWATTLTRFIEFLMILVFILLSKNKNNTLKSTWPQFSYYNLRYLRPFWKLAIFGALSLSGEAWAFEVSSILAGLLGTTALDAHVITMSIASFLFLSFPFAVGIAASIRVGQLIGEQRTDDARRSSYTSYALATIVQGILLLILWPCKDIVAKAFSGEHDDIANLVSQLIPLMCVFMMGDAIQATTCGILRGLGRQRLVLWLNLLAFWVIGVPTGAILAFNINLGTHGLWWGLVTGINASCIIGILLLRFNIDWNAESKKAMERLSIHNLI